MPSLLLILALLHPAAATITSAVGIGRPGDSGEGGPASAAEIREPFDVVYDRAGNLYFADTGNHKIKCVEAGSGRIRTIAGTGRGAYGGDGGPALQAAINQPHGLALDAQGNLYIADRLNARVRRVDGKNGTITTLAGTGEKGYSGDGGPASKARLNDPDAVALDGQGRLVIADVAAHRVRVVDLTTGRIDTLAGDGQPRRAGDGGPARAASFFGPRAVEFGPDGTLYILEREGHSLRAVAPDGTVRTVAGTGLKGYSGDGGPALQATFNGPKELAVGPGGVLLIVDTENHAIRRIDPATGHITSVAGDGQPGGQGDDGPAPLARLNRPHGVTFTPDGGFLIGDTSNHRLRHVAP